MSPTGTLGTREGGTGRALDDFGSLTASGWPAWGSKSPVLWWWHRRLRIGTSTVSCFSRRKLSFLPLWFPALYEGQEK